MLCLKIVLLLTFFATAASQCRYVYVAEPPGGQLICDPFQINNGQLQLVCSIFVTEISPPGSQTLRIQWFFTERINRQFVPVNSILLQEVSFNVLPGQTYTSRIVVSTPPIGFYFCQPVLTSDGQLIQSNVAPLQLPSFYLQRQIRPCMINEFQNSSFPVCAQPGVTLGPDQMITPAPTIIETLQYLSSTIMLTPTPVPAQQTATPMVCNNSDTPAGLIAGVVLGVVFIISLSVVVVVVLLLLIQVKKKKLNSKYPRTYNSRHISSEKKYTSPIVEQSDDTQEAPFVPPRNPPPKLQRLTFGTSRSPRITSHIYNRLRFQKAKSQHPRRSGIESSAYYITPENNGDGIEYYVDYDEEQLDRPYVDESESLVYNDSQYSTESDLHLHQQKKHQTFVTSSSLELESDKEDVHAREAQMTNIGSQLPRRYLKICKTNRVNRNGNSNPSSRGDKSGVSRSLLNDACNEEEMMGTGDLSTNYTNANALEENTV